MEPHWLAIAERGVGVPGRQLDWSWPAPLVLGLCALLVLWAANAMFAAGVNRAAISDADAATTRLAQVRKPADAALDGVAWSIAPCCRGTAVLRLS